MIQREEKCKLLYAHWNNNLIREIKQNNVIDIQKVGFKDGNWK